MDVEHGLAGTGAGIHHHPVPFVSDPLSLGQLLGRQEEFPHQFGMGGIDLSDRGQVGPRDDEDVGRGLGIDVPKGHKVRRGEDHLGRDLPSCDSAEKAIGFSQGKPPFLVLVSDRSRTASSRTIGKSTSPGRFTPITPPVGKLRMGRALGMSHRCRIALEGCCRRDPTDDAGPRTEGQSPPSPLAMGLPRLPWEIPLPWEEHDVSGGPRAGVG